MSYKPDDNIFDSSIDPVYLDIVYWKDEKGIHMMSVGLGGIFTAMRDIDDPLVYNMMINWFITGTFHKGRIYYDKESALGHFDVNSVVEEVCKELIYFNWN